MDNLQTQTSRPTPHGFQNQRYAQRPPPPPPSISLELDKVVSALSTLTSVVQNVNIRVQGIESKMQIVDSYS